jgi:adenylate cyclase
MSKTHQTARMVILFADICDSTVLYAKLGDAQARSVITKCLALMTGEVAPHKGTLVKTVGDAIMCTFSGVDEAMQAACRMQLIVASGRPGGNQPIYIHIGFHYGEVICEDGDVYGDAVNIAARVAGMTRSREIMTTQATADRLSPELKGRALRVFRAEIKGRKEGIEIYRIIWNPEDITPPRIGLPANRKPWSDEAKLLVRQDSSPY